MPKPLFFDPDATKAASQGWWRFFDVGTFSLFLVASAALVHLCSNGYILGASSGRSELLMRALPFLFLAILCALMCAKPRRYRIAESETVDGRYRSVMLWKKAWWNFLLLWPAFVFGEIVIIETFAKGKVGAIHGGDVFAASLSWMVIALLTSAFLLSEIEIRMDNVGIRVGLNLFVEWNRISRIVDTGDSLEVIHADYPFPLVAFRGEDDSEKKLRQQAALHNISIEQGAATNLTTFKTQYAALALILLCAALTSYFWFHAKPLVVFTSFFFFGVILSYRIELWRGMSKVTRIKPAVDKASLKLKPGQTLPEPVLAPPIPIIPDDTSRR